MTFGSGLASQAGWAAETTVGTPATPDHFIAHDEANMDLLPTWAAGAGVHAGAQVQAGSRLVQTTRTATGTFKCDIPTKKFGLLARHMLGSPTTTATLISGSAYKQVHTLGNAAGMALTLQIGVPRSDGTVEPFTYPGTKFTDWELSGKEGGLLQFASTLDAMDELTTGTTPAGPALAAASYVSPSELFSYSGGCTIKIGGTASTASGVCSVAGGNAVATLIRSFNLKTTTPLQASRFGTSQTKREQLQNGYTLPVLTLDAEFASRTEFYDLFRSLSQFPVQITFTGSVISTGVNNVFDILLPAVKITDNKPSGNGLDLSNQPMTLQVVDDKVNNPIQVTIQSADTTL